MGKKGRQAVFDLNFKSWHWSQWLATVAFIIFMANALLSRYVFIKVMYLRTTLMVLVLIVGAIFNYGYVLGLFVEQTEDRIRQYLILPILTIPASMLAFFLMSRVFPVSIKWMAYIRLTLTYIIFSISVMICYRKVTYEYTNFTEEDLISYGIIEEEGIQ